MAWTLSDAYLTRDTSSGDTIFYLNVTESGLHSSVDDTKTRLRWYRPVTLQTGLTAALTYPSTVTGWRPTTKKNSSAPTFSEKLIGSSRSNMDVTDLFDAKQYKLSDPDETYDLVWYDDSGTTGWVRNDNGQLESPQPTDAELNSWKLSDGYTGITNEPYFQLITYDVNNNLQDTENLYYSNVQNGSTGYYLDDYTIGLGEIASSGGSGSVVGDPHVVTFGGSKYTL